MSEDEPDNTGRWEIWGFREILGIYGICAAEKK